MTSRYKLKEIKKKAERILKMIPHKTGLKLLDIGCGEGMMTNEFFKAGYDCEGFDIDEESIEISKRDYPKIKFGVRDAWDVDYSKYDIIISWGVFCYVPDLEGLLKKIEKEMKRGAILIFTIPNICSLNRRLKSLMGKNPTGGEKPIQTITFKQAERLIQPLNFSKKEILPFHYDNILNKMPIRNLNSHIIFRLIK